MFTLYKQRFTTKTHPEPDSNEDDQKDETDLEPDMVGHFSKKIEQGVQNDFEILAGSSGELT